MTTVIALFPTRQLDNVFLISSTLVDIGSFSVQWEVDSSIERNNLLPRPLCCGGLSDRSQSISNCTFSPFTAYGVIQSKDFLKDPPSGLQRIGLKEEMWKHTRCFIVPEINIGPVCKCSQLEECLLSKITVPKSFCPCQLKR